MLKADARASFATLQARLRSGARIAIEPLGRGNMQVLGEDPAIRATSTSKVLILSALLQDKGGVDHLASEEIVLARTAITQSDNPSILAVFNDLEAETGGLAGASAYATGLLRKTDDNQTQVSTAAPPSGYATTFGQTPWGTERGGDLL